MPLRDRYQPTRNQTTDQGLNQRQATWARAYDTPIHGTVDGEPVRILQIGDLPGMSPVFLCVDSAGDATPVRITDVKITDGAFLPLLNQRQLQNT